MRMTQVEILLIRRKANICLLNLFNLTIFQTSETRSSHYKSDGQRSTFCHYSQYCLFELLTNYLFVHAAYTHSNKSSANNHNSFTLKLTNNSIIP